MHAPWQSRRPGTGTREVLSPWQTIVKPCDASVIAGKAQSSVPAKDKEREQPLLPGRTFVCEFH